jgi:hypothetical protein
VYFCEREKRNRRTKKTCTRDKLPNLIHFWIEFTTHLEDIEMYISWNEYFKVTNTKQQFSDYCDKIADLEISHPGT